MPRDQPTRGCPIYGQLQLTLRQFPSDVEQRPRGRGDRDAPTAADVGRVDRAYPVYTNADPAPPSIAIDHGHIEVSRRPRPKLPDSGGRVVAQICRLATGKHSRQLMRQRRKRHVSDGVHTAMNHREPSAGQRVLDRSAPDPERDELCMRDDCVLVRREPAYFVIWPPPDVVNVPVNTCRRASGTFASAGRSRSQWRFRGGRVVRFPGVGPSMPLVCGRTRQLRIGWNRLVTGRARSRDLRDRFVAGEGQ